jgi:hypothetical protein
MIHVALPENIRLGEPPVIGIATTRWRPTTPAAHRGARVPGSRAYTTVAATVKDAHRHRDGARGGSRAGMRSEPAEPMICSWRRMTWIKEVMEGFIPRRPRLDRLRG